MGVSMLCSLGSMVHHGEDHQVMRHQHIQKTKGRGFRALAKYMKGIRVLINSAISFLSIYT